MEAGCKNVVAAEMRGIRVALFHSGCDHLAVVLASPRARECRLTLSLGRAAETTSVRQLTLLVTNSGKIGLQILVT